MKITVPNVKGGVGKITAAVLSVEPRLQVQALDDEQRRRRERLHTRQDWWFVDHQLVDQGYKTVLSGEPKSARGRRVLSLDRETIALLRAQQEQQAKQSVERGLVGAAVYVFTRPDGEPWHPDYMTSHFGVLVRQSRLPVIRLHDLRHTHATLGLAAGILAKVMADRLGHSSVLLTLDTYSHVSPALDAGAADLIARLIRGDDEPSP